MRQIKIKTSDLTDLKTVNVREAEALTGVPAKSWYRLIDDGQLPSYRIGRSVRLAVADIRSFLDRCRRAS